MNTLIIFFIEYFLTVCLETKTEDITSANHKGQKAIQLTNQNLKPMIVVGAKGGKVCAMSQGWVWFYFW